MSLNVPLQGNETLHKVLDRIDASETLHAYWAASNITAIDRLHINDHGPVHIKIMTNIALKLLRLLVAAGVTPGVVKDHGLRPEDAEVVVVLAAALHDVGHAIHRLDHEQLSVVLAAPLVDAFLAGLYGARDAAILKGETLHAILTHQRDIQPLTIEASVVKVADALDMESGRARIPFSTGEPTIHSVSAMAIRKVHLSAGETRPIKIAIEMSNSAGIFQVDNLLREKLKNSTIAPYVEVVAEVAGEEKSIVQRYSIE
ncbi:MAG: HD domain-containing protein [Candidatus Bipolaricaulis sp.]|nr:HD domain-containing protein [Candidatus Bipolaricaulis sp.]MDD5220105.1 HD domain-containing protein [Candidatus Bipolaricaulis sp.]MDD5645757.1 HD domain-containing protein [Candidatus Bipolaricaulis sp.]